MAKTKRIKRRKVRKLRVHYLFTGFVQLSETGDGTMLVPKSLDTLRNRVFFAPDPKRGGKELVAFKTDGKGIIYQMAPGFEHRATPVHKVGAKQVFHIPPPELVMFSWAAKGKGWSKVLKDFVGQIGRAGVELEKRSVLKGHLRPPDPKIKTALENEYAAWYKKLPTNTRLLGYVLPRTRAIVALFSDPAFEGANVLFQSQSGSKQRFEATVRSWKGKIMAAIVFGTPEQMPKGLYEVRVRGFNPSVGCWNRDAEQGSYILHEQVRFKVSNIAGEFEIINCDPISVEEALMVQFPTNYASLMAAAKKTDTYPKLEVKKDYGPVPQPLQRWSKASAWAYDKSKMAVGLVNADGNDERAKTIGVALYDALGVSELKNPIIDAVKKSFDLAFGIHENVGQWEDFKKSLAASDALKHLPGTIAEHVDGYFARGRWFLHAKAEHLAGNRAKILELPQLSARERDLLFKAGIPEKQSALREMLGSGGKVVEKGMVYADQAIALYQLSMEVDKLAKAHGDVKANVSTLASALSKYEEAFGNGASREGLGNLERYRTATVCAELKFDHARTATVQKGIDTALGALCIVPIPHVALAANFVVLVKATADLAYDTLKTALSWADQLCLDNYLAETAGNIETLLKFQESSYANQDLMPATNDKDGGKDNLHVQLRLRAETLYGLVALLTRAGLDCDTDAEYLERVEKYRIQEYVEHMVLGEGWVMPIKPLVPISLDVFWIYARSEWGGCADWSTYASNFGWKTPLVAAAAQLFPWGMCFAGILNEALKHHVTANYHQSLPIHRLDSDTFREFALAFRTNWSNLKEDAVEYTAIYKRKKGSKGHEGWKLLDPAGTHDFEHIEDVSPFDQIRVLVVLEEGLEEQPYPMSLQLLRTDWNNIKGPVYKDIARKLDRILLDDESKWKGRLGCVFYPFYQLGSTTIPGIKPLAGGAVKFFGVGAYDVYGGFTRMSYMFKVRVGSRSSEKDVGLGLPLGRENRECEFPVSIDPSRDGSERRLYIADFLASRSENFEYPTLFQIRVGAGACHVRVGGKGDYQMATGEEDGILEFGDYNWQDSVEFIIFAWSSNLASVNYRKAKLNHKRIPVKMQLVQVEGIDDDGPEYNSKLQKIGTITPGEDGTNAKFRAELTKNIPKNLMPVVEQLKSSPERLRRFANSVDPRNFGSLLGRDRGYHLYAAHLKLHYHTPDGKKHYSLRPFGTILTSPKDYRICIRNIVSQGKSGLAESSMVCGLDEGWASTSGYVRKEFEFRFRAPKSHTSGVPWSTIKTKKELETWIEDDAKKLEPRVEIVKK